MDLCHLVGMHMCCWRHLLYLFTFLPSPTSFRQTQTLFPFGRSLDDCCVFVFIFVFVDGSVFFFCEWDVGDSYPTAAAVYGKSSFYTLMYYLFHHVIAIACHAYLFGFLFCFFFFLPPVLP
ncbi:hypothetical protein, unlikely [Trypanosoma brucei gambiense DAL972]|uniref:Uncharacterized protein n=1 Tax=Trypanosoma brucei gambiense (strain MHOM/CI/86/DAL972) TaxID=679716 RepID=D0A2Y2_TRYB9|nr:hypothetical protein, unlikely [Trypanosoma brucei gambiense DAL972]CBH15626.1 hypothetical protein, unlikely [Trypanosoma brucei gambiense DAL972]|eukprot:XP_011777890.1 hypothetical protein, unlikely [Trypanosoma brucei gambiense DAL972]